MNVHIRHLTAEAEQWAEQEIQAATRAGDPAIGGAVLLDASEEFGVGITWVIMQVTSPDGRPVAIPVWWITVTHPSPLTTEPGLVHCQEIGSPRPDEGLCRAQARQGVTALRAMWAQKLAAGNGQG